MTMGAWAQAHAIHDPRGPFAIVASNPKSFENLYRFMNLAVGDRPIRLFTVMDEAQAWLHQMTGHAGVRLQKPGDGNCRY